MKDYHHLCVACGQKVSVYQYWENIINKDPELAGVPKGEKQALAAFIASTSEKNIALEQVQKIIERHEKSVSDNKE